MVASAHDHDHDGHAHGRRDHGGHAHPHARGVEAGLRLALVLTFVILLVEVAGGLLSHSLALLADAGHVLTDAGALAMALFAARQVHRPADQTRTYGYHRTGILVALLNAAMLIAITLFIVVEAYSRLAHPEKVQTAPMVVAAAIGLVVNLFTATRLHGHGHDLNTRAAWLHVVNDAGASAGVIVAALLIAFTGQTALDPVLSVAIAALIAVGAWRLLNEALTVLMEAAPREINMPELVRQMLGVSGVRDVHDLHVWSIGSGLTALSCHVRIDDQPLCDGLSVVDRLNATLRDRFGIAHCTIQPETTGCAAPDLYCALPCGCCEEPSAVGNQPSAVGE
jgi:cobalt-zinc-cadmium efflux system protein